MMVKKTLHFPGRYASLQQIGDFYQEAARKAGLNDAAIYAVQLAVDEAATNIIEHAYGGEDRGEIQCNYEILAEGLKIMMVDHGRSFDPEVIPEPVTDVALDQVKPRGLGLFFMRKMMDEVDFQFSPKRGNILTMFKRK